MKIRNRLLLITTLIAVIPLLIIAIASRFAISNASIKNSENVLDEISGAVAHHLSEIYNLQVSNLQYASALSVYGELLEADKTDRNSEKYNKTYNEATEMLITGKKMGDNIIRTCLLNKKGEVITSSEQKFEKYQKISTPSVKAVLSGADRYIGIIEYNNTKLIEISFPVLDKSGDSIGLLHRLVDINDINTYLNDFSILNTGYLYVLDSNGDALSHTYPERTGATATKTKDTYQLVELIENIKNKTVSDWYEDYHNVYIESGKVKKDVSSVKNGVITYTYLGKEILAKYQKAPGTDLVVVAAITMKEIMAVADEIFYYILILTVIITILTLVFAEYTSRSIINPLSDIIGIVNLYI